MTEIPHDLNAQICNKAKEYNEQGMSCFPLSLGEKRPLAKWKRFQTEFPLEEDIDDWMDNGAPRTDTETGKVIGRDSVIAPGTQLLGATRIGAHCSSTGTRWYLRRHASMRSRFVGASRNMARAQQSLRHLRGKVPAGSLE